MTWKTLTTNSTCFDRFHPLGASTSPCSTWPSLSPAYHVQLPKSRQTKEVLPLSRPAIVALPRQMQSPGDRKVFVCFCCHFLVWNVMIDDVSPLFPEGLNVWWHFVILLCFLLLKDSFIEPWPFQIESHIFYIGGNCTGGLQSLYPLYPPGGAIPPSPKMDATALCSSTQHRHSVAIEPRVSAKATE